MECLILETARTCIRQLQDSDFENYFQLENNPEVMRYISGNPRSREEARLRFAKQRLEYLRDPGFGVWAVWLKNTEQLVGTACLNFIKDTSIRQIGYKFTPSAHGKGFATEVASAMLQYGFESCGLQEISAVCDPQNKASEKVMQKAGFEYIGTGTFFDTECLHYRIDSATWFLKKKQNCSFTAKLTNA
jgi:ribosomal-protein-alanine N-acetyltransferase